MRIDIITKKNFAEFDSVWGINWDQRHNSIQASFTFKRSKVKGKQLEGKEWKSFLLWRKSCIIPTRGTIWLQGWNPGSWENFWNHPRGQIGIIPGNLLRNDCLPPRVLWRLQVPLQHAWVFAVAPRWWTSEPGSQSQAERSHLAFPGCDGVSL